MQTFYWDNNHFLLLGIALYFSLWYNSITNKLETEV
nr:MAG TPA: Carbohydrate/starch-binding module [Caudoviricetes sp.]